LNYRNKVKLIWVPGHSGVEGNEKADKLAKLGVEEPLLGPEPFCGIIKRPQEWQQISGLRVRQLWPGNIHQVKYTSRE
jgi:ribonuclease HI